MRLGGLLLFALVCAAPLAAQTASPPGPYVIDVRGTMAGLPTAAGFNPPVPANTTVPARGFGLDAGAHVYPIGFGRVRIGIGAIYVRARGTASTDTSTAKTTGTGSPPTTAATTDIPDITTTFSTWAPTLSLNFGRREGWSYLSAGAGRATVRARAVTRAATTERVTENVSTLNVGGGARWFTRAHMALTFDVRFYMLAAGTSTLTAPPASTLGTSSGTTATAITASTTSAATPRATLMVVSVGLSFR